MSVNSNSSFSNDVLSWNMHCITSRPSSFIFTTFVITSILLILPLCIFILHHGLQLWRQKRSTSSAVTVSHSDIFTYHLVVMELVGMVGLILGVCGVYWEDSTSLSVGFILSSFNWFGETFFHVLTCVERYLAVVHPITYLSLRNQRGIRIRNISITCVWLLTFGSMISTLLKDFVIIDFCASLLCLTMTLFCSLSVLCVLIRPGPGEQGGDRERVDQSKLRAFYMIMSIMGVLMIRCAGGFLWDMMYVLGLKANCVTVTSVNWFNLPCSLVLPLLFLYRGGKLVCCKKNNQ